MEIYKQMKKDLDIVVVDYLNQLIDDRNTYKEEERIKMSDRFSNLFLDILSTVYGVDKDMLNEFKKVYGQYPTNMNFQDNEKNVVRDRERMFNLIRILKINKIKKCT